MSYFSKRALRWAAPVALVGALGLAACGDDGDAAVQTGAPAAPSAADVAGSDQHLSNLAEEVREARANAAASARLQGQAEAYQRVDAAQAAAVSSQAELADQQFAYQAGFRPNVSAADAAIAAEAERQAQLEGQARTYGADQ